MKVRIVRPDVLSERDYRAWVSLQETNRAFENPSFNPEFTRAVSRVRSDIEVALVEEDDTLVGVFPYQREKADVAKPVGSLLSEFHGVITAPGFAFNAIELLKACKLKCWYFDHLLVHQPAFLSHQKVVNPSPYMDVSDGYEAYLEERRASGSSIIKDAARKRRKIEREFGPLEFRFDDGSADMFELLMKWKRDQVIRQGFEDIFRHAWVRALMAETLHTKTDEFSGILSTLYAGEVPVAAMLGICGNGNINSWIPTFNPEFSRHSPGLLLHLDLARYAAENGFRRIELGRGENRMKFGLMNGHHDVALGSVDLRPVARMLTAAWYGMRDIAHSPQLGGWPLKSARKIKNLMVNSKGASR